MQFTDEWLVPTIEKVLTPDELESLRQEPSAEPQSLWLTVVGRKLANDEEVLRAAAARFRLPVADLTQLDRTIRDAVPEPLIRRFNILPLRLTDSVLEIATANPFDIDAEKDLAFATGREVRSFLSSPSRIREKMEELYRGTAAAAAGTDVMAQLLGGMDEGTQVTQLEDDDGVTDLAASAEEASQRPVVRLVDLMLSDGILSRASDIHVEPGEAGVAVRYRIDGVLRQVMNIPRTAGAPLISRIKIMSGLDIADRLRPQDGRARVAVNGAPVDLRVSTLPASHGEKVVIRILNAKATVLTLESLGMSPPERVTMEALLNNKEGIILVTGPTGSGKTTTLYSMLRLVQSEGVNIVTVEDPVEYRLGKGIVQVQVHEKAGLTFAAALRSILRQDPDVVLLGEIRDKETAQIAVQASLTGHLVLSTLHTNDAANAVTRLVDMGIEAYKLASALRGVIAQRLMRKLCVTCRELNDQPPPERMRRYIPAGTKIYRPLGCPDCSMTGYRGRFSVVEVLTMSVQLEKLIGAGATAEKIAEAGRASGMLSLFESGLQHVLAGETSVDELLRVVDVPLADSATATRLSGTAPPKPVEAPAPRQTPPSTPAPTAPVAARGSLATVADLSSAFELIEETGDEAETGRRPSPPRGISVLLVDDEDSLRRVMRDLLARDGFEVVEARTGIEALDQVDRHAPDVVVLDLNLPGMDGYSVLSELRSRPATQHIPVIVLTAKGDEDNEVRVFELGADDFLSKPFRAKALSKRLEVVLARRK
ncbi:MAG TPA: type II/IV secretion system protein [Gemmatimonadales bacterium]|jgi:type II secretory ATPase GspE/PulE/Tfp pilus assembly ATPase PilB-like protein/CheY-like chemotaxis protein